MVNTQANYPRRLAGLNGDPASTGSGLLQQLPPVESNCGSIRDLADRGLIVRQVATGLLLAWIAAGLGCATGSTMNPMATQSRVSPAATMEDSLTNQQQADSDDSADRGVTARRPDPDHPVAAVVRGQDAWANNPSAPGTNEYRRYPMTASHANGSADAGPATIPNQVPQADSGSYAAGSHPIRQPISSNTSYPPADAATSAGVPTSSGTATGGPGTVPSSTPAGESPWLTSPFLGGDAINNTPSIDQLPGTPLPVNVRVQEARTGRFMFGAGVNSDAGVTGQIIVDERNFDLFGFPTSLDDVWNGEAFRGRGQGFRLEAVPGNRVQRYLISFTEPYLFQSRVSLNASGFLYDRGYYDWTESRTGGRLGLGYRLTPDLSASAAIRAEGVRIKNPRVVGVPALDRVLGNNSLYSGRFSLRHDTRDVPFAPTEGHLIELSYEQVFGDFDYPRGEFDYRRYFLVRERADGSGRHTISLGLGAGFSGDDTPLFENYFAGGFSTLRGFEFRGASPIDGTVTVGGRFRMLGSAEYTMPITADDMIKAVAFCDFGTVEQDIEIVSDHFRVAPGFGFRIAVPALGPAPLAFDFAFPIAQADTDETQVFSFFFGLGRG